MVEQAVPIIPNMGGQEAAVAGSQGVIFTATDRKLIEERGGRVDRSRSFIDALFKERPLTPEVENEETTVKPHQDTKELQGRKHEHQEMLKHSALYVPREQVEIRNELPDTFEDSKEAAPGPEPQPSPSSPTAANLAEIIRNKTIAIVKELKLNPAEILEKFTLEQKELHTLISKVKEYHLKRLLTNDPAEFESLSRAIEETTLSSVKPEGRTWLKAKLNQLSLSAAEYKLKLTKSLQKMELNPQHDQSIKWLKQVIARLKKA